MVCYGIFWSGQLLATLIRGGGGSQAQDHGQAINITLKPNKVECLRYF